jgi:hypothetical protein
MSRLIAFARRLSPSARGIRVNSGPYVSETDQTAQTDRRVENQRKFAAPLGRKQTPRHSELTSGPDHSGLVGASARCAVRAAGSLCAASICDSLLRSRCRTPWSPRSESKRPRSSTYSVQLRRLSPRGNGRALHLWKTASSAGVEVLSGSARCRGLRAIRSAPGPSSWRTPRASWTAGEHRRRVLLLRGKELVALTDAEAAIRTTTGAHQTYRRRPHDSLHPAERCLVWELGDA